MKSNHVPFPQCTHNIAKAVTFSALEKIIFQPSIVLLLIPLGVWSLQVLHFLECTFYFPQISLFYNTILSLALDSKKKFQGTQQNKTKRLHQNISSFSTDKHGGKEKEAAELGSIPFPKERKRKENTISCSVKRCFQLNKFRL